MRFCWVAGGLVALSLSLPATELRKDAAGLPSVPEAVSVDWLLVRPGRAAGAYRGRTDLDLVLENGLAARRFRLGPNAATVGLEQRVTGESFVRAVRPEGYLSIGGERFPVGGLEGQPVGNYLDPRWLGSLRAPARSFVFVGFEVGPLAERFGWRMRKEWGSVPVQWPPKGVELKLHFTAPEDVPGLRGLRVTVHHELHDGLPLFCKWLTLTNASSEPVRLDTFVSETLALVEAGSEVEEIARPRLPDLHVETDFTTVAMSGESAQRQTVYWQPDTNYTTQVNYRLQTPCLLEVKPPLGPGQWLRPGEVFESFRTWILVLEQRDEIRRTLALSRMYRAVAPWSAENPLIFHVRSADPQAVRFAIDQAREVGFELVILTFGSGFNIENEDPAYLASMRDLATYARERGVALGGYSLLASRSLGPEHDVVNPATGKPGGFAIFENSPCLGSRWGQDYFRKLRRFIEETGMEVLEHDGSYPGDACASTTHPGHHGYEDSRWNQWKTVTQFYRWCRGRGVYLNVPDWYFLHGSSKTGMGYRETNWSLPREQQEIIERQNIPDGTRFKSPTMGWMFVPLTEYHGGGAAATIEPLDEHRDHYERRLANLFGAGVQACYRGPRLFDTPATRALVRKWVGFYKANRAILDSPLIPLRRADGQDWDGWIHVNPEVEPPALAMVYNPLPEAIEREISLPLYYSGLSGKIRFRIDAGEWHRATLDRRDVLRLVVPVPARGSASVEIRRR